MTRYGADYVLSAAGDLDCDPTDFDTDPSFERVYSSGGVTIWRLADS